MEFVGQPLPPRVSTVRRLLRNIVPGFMAIAAKIQKAAPMTFVTVNTTPVCKRIVIQEEHHHLPLPAAKRAKQEEHPVVKLVKQVEHPVDLMEHSVELPVEQAVPVGRPVDQQAQHLLHHHQVVLLLPQVPGLLVPVALGRVP